MPKSGKDAGCGSGRTRIWIDDTRQAKVAEGEGTVGVDEDVRRLDRGREGGREESEAGGPVLACRKGGREK